jgi:hypothetical protein
MTHHESPWLNAPKNVAPIITHEALHSYFDGQAEKLGNGFDLKEVWSSHDEMLSGGGTSFQVVRRIMT